MSYINDKINSIVNYVQHDLHLDNMTNCQVIACPYVKDNKGVKFQSVHSYLRDLYQNKWIDIWPVQNDLDNMFVQR